MFDPLTPTQSIDYHSHNIDYYIDYFFVVLFNDEWKKNNNDKFIEIILRYEKLLENSKHDIKLFQNWLIIDGFNIKHTNIKTTHKLFE